MADKAYQITLDGDAVDDAFYDDVVSLTVDESTTDPTSFHLRLATSKRDDGSWPHLDDPRFALFNPVSIQIGFTGGGGVLEALGNLLSGGGNDGLEPVFDGYITGVEVTLGSEPDNAFIDVSGMDACVLMSLEEKIATWKDLADSDIVKQIVGGGYGLTIQVDATPTVHQQNDTTIVQRGTDLQFVRELARRNGLEFYVETDKASESVIAYLRTPQVDGTPQPDLAIQFGDDSNLRRFTVRLSGQRPLSVRAEQIDVKTNRPNRAQVSATQLATLGADDADVLIGGPLASLVTPKDARAQTLVLGPPTSDPTELQTLAQSVRDEASWLISAEGEVNGDAYGCALRPRRPVLVKGAGIYDGRYYVTRVRHELVGDGTYTQAFEARRNARDVDGSEPFGDDGLAAAVAGLTPPVILGLAR
jgi:phage protein D